MRLKPPFRIGSSASALPRADHGVKLTISADFRDLGCGGDQKFTSVGLDGAMAASPPGLQSALVVLLGE
jgi:hypothetical protein